MYSKTPLKTKILFLRSMLSALTIFRFLNLIKNKWALQQKNYNTSPIAFSLETSTACNLACPECPTGLKDFSRPMGSLRKETVELTLKKFAQKAIWCNLYLQGEPLLHKSLIEFIKKIKCHNLVVNISTNGTLLTQQLANQLVESKLDRIIISLDGLTQESYSFYRKQGKLQDVLNGISYIQIAKRNAKSKFPIVSLQTIINSKNQGEIDDIKAFYESSGANQLLFKTAQVFDVKDPNAILPKTELSRYSNRSLKNPSPSFCKRLASSTAITWDGQIIPCCFDKDAEYAFGNVNEDSPEFAQIKRKEFTLDFKNSIKPLMCQNCSENQSVWL